MDSMKDYDGVLTDFFALGRVHVVKYLALLIERLKCAAIIGKQPVTLEHIEESVKSINRHWIHLADVRYDNELLYRKEAKPDGEVVNDVVRCLEILNGFEEYRNSLPRTEEDIVLAVEGMTEEIKDFQEMIDKLGLLKDKS